MKRIVIAAVLCLSALVATAQAKAIQLAGEGWAAPILVDEQDWASVIRAAHDLSDDVRKVCGTAPTVVQQAGGTVLPVFQRTAAPSQQAGRLLVGTIGHSRLIDGLVRQKKLDVARVQGQWEAFVIDVVDGNLVIAGSDKRGTIYGIYEVSRHIGVSPWYWWADVPVARQDKVCWSGGRLEMPSPTVKYRGIFINDEDWSLLSWSARNYEAELGDIGPRTYARVCELLLRLRANMLAPAMHSCTGAFYSHPESKVVCDSFGIVITTSHCEPLLLNNAADSEWNQQRDGDWNYKTNRSTIQKKWDDRLAEASQYENIYTVAMRGVHDAGLRGNLPMEERVPLIDTVIRDQRLMLERHIGRKATDIPQIFVPYKETMDIYENGLRVPDDITLVWVDDNYGYMKRVSNPEEQRRSGRSGIYYHLSYLGAPHDYLWLNTTPPVLMYEELKKAYDTGADRYWLLNVGDIKPMELGIQTFMDMAWNIHAFDIESVNRHQAEWLAANVCRGIATTQELQQLLDDYYRLAWIRKPEFMGGEYEWDDPAHTGLKPVGFSFQNGEAQRRLAEYQRISEKSEELRVKSEEFATALERSAKGSAEGTAVANSKLYTLNSTLKDSSLYTLNSALKDSSLYTLNSSLYHLLQFPIQAAYQMNRKFLMAQLNQELAAAGRAAEANWAARQAEAAFDSIEALNRRYNEQMGDKWRHFMTVPPGFCALYQQMPEVTYQDGAGETPVDLTPTTQPQQGCYKVSLSDIDSKTPDVSLVKGLGYDWQVVQLGAPLDVSPSRRPAVSYAFPAVSSDTVEVTVHTVPFWPVYAGRSNAISVSVDGGEPQIFENKFKEYDRNWKDQVMCNGASCRLRFAIDQTRPSHEVRFESIDPGQMLQQVTIRFSLF